jgi:cell division septation protein DedD
MSQLSTPPNRIFGSLREFFAEIDGTKSAAVKAADKPISEPGSIGGETSHPSKNVDDRLIPEQTGARYSENTSDVKKDVGAPSVENAPTYSWEGKGSGKQMEHQMQIGAKHAPTGEDPSVEHDFKGDKEDPGTTSVMKADDGHKYGSYEFKKLAGMLGTLGNDILADISNGKLVEKKAAPGDGEVHSRGQTFKVQHSQQPTTPKDPPKGESAPQSEQEPEPELDEATKQAAAIGYQLAALQNLDEPAADARVAEMFEHIIKEAQIQADLTAQYMDAFAGTIKRAGDPTGGGGEDHSAPGDESSGANPAAGIDPTSGGSGDPTMGGGGGGGGTDPLEIIASLPPEALQQIAMMVQSGAIPGMGGDPSGGGGGGMPPGGGGGMPPGGGGMPPGGGDPSGGGGDQAEHLNGAMHEMGVSPDELEAAAPKVASEQRSTLLKLAQVIRKKRRDGKLGYKVASTPEEQQIRAQLRGYLAEILSN